MTDSNSPTLRGSFITTVPALHGGESDTERAQRIAFEAEWRARQDRGNATPPTGPTTGYVVPRNFG
jgi:hypothetical protein